MVIIHSNPAGRARALASAGVRDALRETGEALAEEVRTQGVLVEHIPGDIAIPVEVFVSDDDDARASVALAHPSGLAAQAKNGLLTRAASSLGLEVNG